MRGGEESASVLVERCRAGCDVGTLCGGCGGTGVVGPREMASLVSCARARRVEGGKKRLSLFERAKGAMKPQIGGEIGEMSIKNAY